MSQDESTQADTLAAVEQDSSSASFFDFDSETGSDASGESVTAHDPDFVVLDNEGKAVGSADEGKPEGEEGAAEAKPEGEGEGEEGDAAEGEPEADKVDDKPKKLNGSARLKAQNAELRAKLAELTAGSPEIKAGDDTAFKAEVDRRAGERPKEEDYENFLDFETAKGAYEADKRAVTREVRREVENADRARTALADSEKAAAREVFAERLDEVEKLVPGAMAKIEAAHSAGKMAATPILDEAITGSDKSGLLTLHFAEHPEKLAELNKMPPIAALRKLGAIEAGLSPPKPKTQTQAPPPPPKAPRGAAPARSADADLQAAMTRMYGGK